MLNEVKKASHLSEMDQVPPAWHQEHRSIAVRAFQGGFWNKSSQIQDSESLFRSNLLSPAHRWFSQTPLSKIHHFPPNSINLPLLSGLFLNEGSQRPHWSLLTALWTSPASRRWSLFQTLLHDSSPLRKVTGGGRGVQQWGTECTGITGTGYIASLGHCQEQAAVVLRVSRTLSSHELCHNHHQTVPGTERALQSIFV